MDLLSPAPKRPALYRQAITKVFHLFAKMKLPGLDAIELRGKDVDYIGEAKRSLGGRLRFRSSVKKTRFS